MVSTRCRLLRRNMAAAIARREVPPTLSAGDCSNAGRKATLALFFLASLLEVDALKDRLMHVQREG